MHRVTEMSVIQLPVHNERRLLGMQVVGNTQLDNGSQQPTTFSMVFVEHSALDWGQVSGSPDRFGH